MNPLRKLKDRWTERKIRKLEEARADGYGWAWAAWAFEGVSLEKLDEISNADFAATSTERLFDYGIWLAVRDIAQFQAMRKHQTGIEAGRPNSMRSMGPPELEGAKKYEHYQRVISERSLFMRILFG